MSNLADVSNTSFHFPNYSRICRRKNSICLIKKTLLFSNFALSILLSSSLQAKDINQQPYKLAWQDEFNAKTVGDWSENRKWVPYWIKWAVRHLAGNEDEAVKMADYEILQNGKKVGDVLRQTGLWGNKVDYLHDFSGGTLKLRGYPVPEGKRPDFWGFPYVAGMISSERSFAQRNGYWETRFKLNNVSKGHHVAVWLLPVDGTWPPEIDMLEVVGQKPTIFTANSHGEMPEQSFTEYLGSPRWHVLGFERTAKIMKWTLDGRVVRQHPNFAIDKSLYLLFSWEIGSKWPGDPDASTVWPAEIEIDYVRVYKPR